jgi:nitroreductase
VNFDELVRKTRSYRRFDQSTAISRNRIVALVDLLRSVPSAGNRQPLRYVASCGPQMNARIFETLGWAASLPDWPGPEEGERPAGYVVFLHDSRADSSWHSCDVGIAAQTLLLAATAEGLGGCMFGNVRKKRLQEILQVPEHLEIVLVVALGKPVEKIVLDEAAPEGSLTYYREPDGTHHVPKRPLAEALLGVHEE